MFYVYAIRSKAHNYIYKGITNNLQRRLFEHNSKKSKTTRSYAPFELIFLRKAATRREARKYEKWLKSGEGREFLRAHADVVEMVDTQP